MPDGQPERADRYLPIGAYAVIGNCHTAALVGIDGSIDWFCPGRFDAPAALCRVLDAERGGYFSVAPVGQYRVRRAYRDDTNILETTFETADGAGGGRVRLVDFMPLAQRARTKQGQDVETSGAILRLVEALDGDVELALCFKPTFDFARGTIRLMPAPGGVVAEWPDDVTRYLALACPGIPIEPDGEGGARGRLRLRAGERRWLALSFLEDEDAIRPALPGARDGADAGARPGDSYGAYDDQLAATETYWRRWSAACTYRGPYRPLVLRSALALKLLTYEPTGAIVAAPTTSLPELIGGVRNWDYRYTWLRDASLLLYALMTAGYQDEAGDFFAWLHRTQELDPASRPQIMYTIDEGRDLSERTLEKLAGYRDSRPVRVGNAASQQVQLDIYGEVLTLLSTASTRSWPMMAWSTATVLLTGCRVGKEPSCRAASGWSKPSRSAAGLTRRTTFSSRS